MRKYRFILHTAVFFAVFFCSYSTASAEYRSQGSDTEETPFKAIGPQLGYMSGKTLYHISSYDTTGTSGIESELEFPIQAVFIGIEYSFGRKDPENRDIYKFKITWLTNMSGGSGKMKDSDWLTDDFDITAPPSPPYPPNSGYPHPGLDIYSESDISLSANIIDIQFAYSNRPRPYLSIGPYGGFKYENFHYDVSNTNQVGYGPYNIPTYTGYISGKTLDYEVTYLMLYFGVHAELAMSKVFQVGAKLGFSPAVSAEDTDDHLLRYKLSEGSATGQAYMADLSGEWALGNRDLFKISGSYMKINTTGTQTQYFYAGPYAGLGGTVDDKITSTQTSLMLTFTHGF
jgi:outer membrane protease